MAGIEDEIQPPTIKWDGGKFTLTYGGACMIANLSVEASGAMLDALSELLNGGLIELLSGDGTTLAVLQLSNPAAKVSGGELEFNEIAEGVAITQGNAEIALIFSSDGSEVLSVDVGAPDSDAVIKFSRTQLNEGEPVRLDSFRLALP